VVAGRLICDTYIAAQEYSPSKQYSLSHLCAFLLSEERIHIEDNIKCFNASNDLLAMIRYAENDCRFQIKIMLKLMFLGLTKQLTCIAGNTWPKTLISGRSERNEWLLSHSFFQRKFILPEKESFYKKKELSKKKASFSGGLVLEPKKGLYKNFVMLLDFNSLYPSIIQEYNICFTTVEKKETPDIPDSSLEQGVLPKLLLNLVSRRKQVKGMMKDLDPKSAEYLQLNIRQQALKLTANSINSV
jgi:DNA polymerase alpha subunit A